MYRLIFLISIILLFCSGGLKSQNFGNFAYVDSVTYSYYLHQQWDSLINASDEALNNDIDYFYLRLRAGIAFFEKGQYRKAIKHFEKAYTFNKGDDLTAEYLYFSYINSGLKTEALALSSSFSPKLASKLETDKVRLFSALYIEGGPTLGNNPVQNHPSGFNQLPGNQTIYSEEELTNDMRYFSFGLKHNLTKKISLFHAFSTIDIGKKQHILVYGGDINNDYRIYQRQYYINMQFVLKNGFKLTPALHFINVNFDKLFYNFDENSKLFLKQGTEKFNNIVTSLSLSKSYTFFDIEFNTVLSRLNSQNQKQLGFSSVYYPFANPSFFVGAKAAWQKDNSRICIIPEVNVGGRLGEKVFVNAFYTILFNDYTITNFSENNAYIVYNINDYILGRKGASFKYIINPHLELGIYYQNLRKLNSILNVNVNKEIILNTKKDFINHSIIGGIKWTL